ncbi:putative toxin-antitoxin system toxin component, PIN family [Candidatus Microgenomates bacterium]|nr:putative toxin-antitoxin system toxin component, PIN family [Candidatus Microgenomates bacterium]
MKKNLQVVSPKVSVKVSRDPDDNRVLEAAGEGDCDFIITGDQDLLELGKYQKIKILTAKNLLTNFYFPFIILP